MNQWEYKIPTVRGAPRGVGDKKRGSLTQVDLKAPRVSLYCAHDGHGEELWLFGSFVPNFEWYEQTGEARWSWTTSYPTGEGFEIRLRANSSHQSIVGNKAVDPSHDSGAAGDPKLRARYRFVCGTCDTARTWVDDSIQEACAYLLTVNHREADLQFFDRVVAAANR